MEITQRKREEFAKRPRVVDDTQHSPRGTMPAEAASAPFAAAARQVDLARDAPAQPSGIFSGGGIFARDDFAHELMPGRSRESIIAALQLEVG